MYIAICVKNKTDFINLVVCSLSRFKNCSYVILFIHVNSFVFKLDIEVTKRHTNLKFYSASTIMRVIW